MVHGRIHNILKVRRRLHPQLHAHPATFIVKVDVVDSVKVAKVDARVHVEEDVLTVVTQSAQLVRDAPIRVVVVAQIVVAQLVLVSVQDAVRDVQIVPAAPVDVQGVIILVPDAVTVLQVTLVLRAGIVADLVVRPLIQTAAVQIPVLLPVLRVVLTLEL